MNFPNQKSIISSVILAVVGFVIAEFLLSSLALNGSVFLALGLLIGGLVVASLSTADVEEEKVKTKTLYVGNLPYRANEGIVRELFEEHGKVFSVRLLKDKNTGKRRGFGFVEVAEKDAANTINSLNDFEFQQRTLKVREAKQKSEDGDNQFNDETVDQSA
ncbi:RNA recognition motif domain-containing protein [Pseudoalteromonas tunicata]|jgi:RNA recognition motif-containing protein|uniref:RRM domain-containing protein n=1 Tax=Pseudoalteromonas tunicata D2 TaxID=87626 RepID=A4CFR2_9GAMM|nr:RNA-binding protein [Pseudoalteromonas tunicata]ATC92914.1 hypothetical protein PTUN_a0069 [Pseudoalteromonas tunicata]AXT32014.1 RNA-binding protein [Pseudoalteromonas tunicata]EAR26400.1 hypothetical protein PTD2_09597 [Pseudoalteromonas tunicata D2]MDP4985582.1 RNA-binding protein [Pseudoalteromonas tunicata]MDP5215305.1 RNA-binding protein [Pseudoalteromonas tunicata]